MSFGGGVIEFVPVMPIGARSGSRLSSSGAANHAWLDKDVPQYVQEEQDLVGNVLHPGLTRRQHRDALSQLRMLKKRAASGQLRIGHDASYPARHLARCPYIIELRPKLQGGATRVVRLYYAEPDNVESMLLPLVLDTKPTGGNGSGVQNASIDEAKNRSRVWTLLLQMREASK